MTTKHVEKHKILSLIWQQMMRHILKWQMKHSMIILVPCYCIKHLLHFGWNMAYVSLATCFWVEKHFIRFIILFKETLSAKALRFNYQTQLPYIKKWLPNMLRRNMAKYNRKTVTRLCIFYLLGPYQITDLNL